MPSTDSSKISRPPETVVRLLRTVAANITNAEALPCSSERPLGKEYMMEAQPDILTFPSKIDLWLVVVVGVSVGAPLLAMGYRVLVMRDTKLVPPVLVLAGATAFILWLYASTAYRITGDMLLVRSGPVRIDVPLKSVTALRASRSPLSAPALSLDRIEVSYDSKRVVISPWDRTAFVAAMKQRLPHVQLEGL